MDEYIAVNTYTMSFTAPLARFSQRIILSVDTDWTNGADDLVFTVGWRGSGYSQSHRVSITHLAEMADIGCVVSAAEKAATGIAREFARTTLPHDLKGDFHD